MNNNSKPNYTFALIVVFIVLFLIGFITTMNNSMIEFCKNAFQLNNFQSQLVNSAFYGAYIMSIPFGLMMSKIGYKSTLVLGLAVVGIGFVINYLCINNNPAVICVFAASVWGMNDVTHLGLFDIPMLSNIPNLVYLAPTCKEEYFAMLRWGMRQTSHPVAIRVPGNGVICNNAPVDADYGDLNRYKVMQQGDTVAIIAAGSFYQLGETVAQQLHEQQGITPTLINPSYLTGTDDKMLDSMKKDHRLVITLEDGILDGGFGEKIARFYGDSDMRVLNYGLRKEFVDRYDAGELLSANRLTAPQIVEDIATVL